jgi:HSP20 family protein
MATRESRISRWDPFRELGELEPWNSFGGLSRLGRVMEDAFGERARTAGLTPAVDVTETEDHYEVTAEVPGVKRDDVVVELHEGVLTVRGEKRSEHEEKDGKRRWLERSYGTFSRSFSLPRDADPDQVDASFKDGVLTVRISKAAEAKPQTIAIKG